MATAEPITLAKGDSRLKEELAGDERIAVAGFGMAGFQEFAATGADDPRQAWRLMTQENRAAAMPYFRDLEVKDTHFGSQIETRKEAVLTLPWRVEARETKRGRTPDALVDELKDVLDNIFDFDNVLNEILDCIGKGVSIGEILYDTDGRQIFIKEIKFRPQEWFAFGGLLERQTGELRLGQQALLAGAEAEVLPWNKFLTTTFKPHLGNRWGSPLGRACYWPSWMSRHGFRFWSRYLEKGTGTVLTKYPAGDDTLAQKALEVSQAISEFTAVGVPENVAVEILEQARQGGTETYEKFVAACQALISKRTVGQTLTSAGSDQGAGSRALGEVHNEVRGEKKQVDARLLMWVINEQLIKPYVALNHGPEAIPAKWTIEYEDEEDLNERAERDERLVGIGVKIPQMHFEDVYDLPPTEGLAEEQLVRKPAAPAAPAPGAGGRGGPPLQRPEEFADAGDPEPVVIAEQGVEKASAMYVALIGKAMEAAEARLEEEDRDRDSGDGIREQRGRAAREVNP